jgi:hypothetical protein
MVAYLCKIRSNTGTLGSDRPHPTRQATALFQQAPGLGKGTSHRHYRCRSPFSLSRWGGTIKRPMPRSTLPAASHGRPVDTADATAATNVNTHRSCRTRLLGRRTPQNEPTQIFDAAAVSSEKRGQSPLNSHPCVLDVGQICGSLKL